MPPPYRTHSHKELRPINQKRGDASTTWMIIKAELVRSGGPDQSVATTIVRRRRSDGDRRRSDLLLFPTHTNLGRRLLNPAFLLSPSFALNHSSHGLLLLLLPVVSSLRGRIFSPFLLTNSGTVLTYSSTLT